MTGAQLFSYNEGAGFSRRVRGFEPHLNHSTFLPQTLSVGHMRRSWTVLAYGTDEVEAYTFGLGLQAYDKTKLPISWII
jgi:hypothetical protein